MNYRNKKLKHKSETCDSHHQEQLEIDTATITTTKQTKKKKLLDLLSLTNWANQIMESSFVWETSEANQIVGFTIINKMGK